MAATARIATKGFRICALMMAQGLGPPSSAMTFGP